MVNDKENQFPSLDHSLGLRPRGTESRDGTNSDVHSSSLQRMHLNPVPIPPAPADPIPIPLANAKPTPLGNPVQIGKGELDNDNGSTKQGLACTTVCLDSGKTVDLVDKNLQREHESADVHSNIRDDSGWLFAEPAITVEIGQSGSSLTSEDNDHTIEPDEFAPSSSSNNNVLPEHFQVGEYVFCSKPFRAPTISEVLEYKLGGPIGHKTYEYYLEDALTGERHHAKHEYIGPFNPDFLTEEEKVQPVPKYGASVESQRKKREPKMPMPKKIELCNLEPGVNSSAGTNEFDSSTSTYGSDIGNSRDASDLDGPTFGFEREYSPHPTDRDTSLNKGGKIVVAPKAKLLAVMHDHGFYCVKPILDFDQF